MESLHEADDLGGRQPVLKPESRGMIMGRKASSDDVLTPDPSVQAVDVARAAPRELGAPHCGVPPSRVQSLGRGRIHVRVASAKLGRTIGDRRAPWERRSLGQGLDSYRDLPESVSPSDTGFPAWGEWEPLTGRGRIRSRVRSRPQRQPRPWPDARD
jgi:hypothetical protein